MQDNVRVYVVILLKVDHTLSLYSGPPSVAMFRCMCIMIGKDILSITVYVHVLLW